MGITDRYILDENGEPRVEPDLMKWATWFENTENRVVAHDDVAGVYVSTIFLALDHDFSGVGDPVLWETMCFPLVEGLGSPYRGFQQRYRSKREALEGHRKVVQMLTS